MNRGLDTARPRIKFRKYLLHFRYIISLLGGGSNLLVGSSYYFSDNRTVRAYCKASHIVGPIQMYCYACVTWIQVREEIEEELIE